MKDPNDVFIYDETTGELFSKRSGRKAGHITEYGYVRLWFDGKNKYAHVVIWAMKTGEWPKNQIDHIDGIRHNNVFSNLREATGSQNMMNSGAHRDNPLGIKGVRQVKNGKYDALIRINGKIVSKRLPTIEGCVAWLSDMRKKHHGEFARD